MLNTEVEGNHNVVKAPIIRIIFQGEIESHRAFNTITICYRDFS